MIRRFVCTIGLAALVGIAAIKPACTEVVSIAVGVTTHCPYGLVVCYPGVHEAISHMDGVKSVSNRCSPTEWTFEVTMQDGRLPDCQAMVDALKPLGTLFEFRGMEATINGLLVKQGDHYQLQVTGSDMVLTLTPLKLKVQYDPVVKKPYPPTAAEHDAYHGLTSLWKGKPLTVCVIGPVTDAAKGALKTLQVRKFNLLP